MLIEDVLFIIALVSLLIGIASTMCLKGYKILFYPKESTVKNKVDFCILLLITIAYAFFIIWYSIEMAIVEL